jgi:hypothetical protein
MEAEPTYVWVLEGADDPIYGVFATEDALMRAIEVINKERAAEEAESAKARAESEGKPFHEMPLIALVDYDMFVYKYPLNVDVYHGEAAKSGARLARCHEWKTLYAWNAETGKVRKRGH